MAAPDFFGFWILFFTSYLVFWVANFSYRMLSYIITGNFCVGSIFQFDSVEISVERIVRTCHFVGSTHSRISCSVLKGCRQTDRQTGQTDGQNCI